MNNRRDFLKSLLGVVFVAPAAAACRTVLPEPVVLPARHDVDAYDRRNGTVVDFKYGRMGQGKTYCTSLEQYNVQAVEADKHLAEYRARFPNHAVFPTRTWVGPCNRPQNIRRGTHFDLECDWNKRHFADSAWRSGPKSLLRGLNGSRGTMTGRYSKRRPHFDFATIERRIMAWLKS